MWVIPTALREHGSAEAAGHLEKDDEHPGGEVSDFKILTVLDILEEVADGRVGWSQAHEERTL